MNYQRLIGVDPSYSWFNRHIRRNPSQICIVSSFSEPNIGLRFLSLYLSRGLIIGQGSDIVNTILVVGFSELRAATYTKGEDGEVIIVGMHKNTLHELVQELFIDKRCQGSSRQEDVR